MCMCHALVRLRLLLLADGIVPRFGRCAGRVDLALERVTER